MKLFIPLVILSVMAVVVGWRIWGNKPSVSAVEAVDGFYQWYLSQPESPLAAKLYATRTDLTETFKQEAGQAVGFDPFLCAQDKPESILVSNYLVQDNEATVETTQTFNSGKRVVPVSLVKEGNKWRINKVGCDKINGSSQDRVVVYYSNTDRAGSETDCSLVYGVERPVAGQPTKQQALEALFTGPTAAEQEQGYSSFFSDKTAGLLKKLTAEDGVAYVDLHDPRPLIPNASTSCGSAAFLASIKETLMHDREIKKVMFAIEGDRAAFYEWLQIALE